MRTLRMSFLWPVTLAVLSIFAMPALASSMGDASHKIVIQISTDDLRTQTIAMNNAVNLQKHYGVDDVEVEIVAYGPGLSMMIAGGEQSQRVESLAKQGITFSACGNTMKRIEQRDGKVVAVSKGVQVVPSGIVRITELQEQGYSYARP